YDPATHVWQTVDRDQIRHIIRDPVEQARRSKHELLKKLRNQRGWRRDRLIRFRHGVVFPNAQTPPSQLGADRPRELFCCRSELPTIAAWIKNRLSGENEEEGPGITGMQALERLLAAPFTLRFPLGHMLSDDDQRIAVLTPQQFYILDAIADVKRAAVGG